MVSERSALLRRLNENTLVVAAVALGACTPSPEPHTAVHVRTQTQVATLDESGASAAPPFLPEPPPPPEPTPLPELAPPEPTSCFEARGAAPQAAFDEPSRGCDVQPGNWDQVFRSARAELSFGFGPECAEDELEGCIQECAASDLDACIGLVNARLRGSRVELRQPLERVAAGCAQEHAEACNAVANMWANGLGSASVDRARAFTYRKEACRLGQGAACAPLGHMYKNGRDGIERNVERGYELLKQGCQMGSASACNDFGWSMVNDGWGKPRNPERALRLFIFACIRGSAHGCGSLGEALEKGWGSAIDRERARMFWNLQCEHHEMPEACAAVARLSDESAPRK
jgi:hypothetical protein